MSFFYRTPYQSEVTRFIDSLKAKDPKLEGKQRQGRELLWDKVVDRGAQGEYREAHEYFEKAFHEAQGHQDTETANLARLSLGVTDGSREFDEFIKGMAAA